jgi:hypothetical protein
MILNKSARLILGHRLGTSTGPTGSEFYVSLWSGTPPTFTEINDALEASTLKQYTPDTTIGRIGSRSLFEWLEGMGSRELVRRNYPANGSVITLTSDETAQLDLSNQDGDLLHVEDGLAGFFVFMNATTNINSSNARDADHTIFNLFIGTVGAVGSGAEMEVVDPNITVNSVVKPGLLNIKY